MEHTLFVFAKDIVGRQQPHDAEQRPFVRFRFSDQFLNGHGSLFEDVGNSECRGDVERTGQVDRVNHAVNIWIPRPRPDLHGNLHGEFFEEVNH